MGTYLAHSGFCISCGSHGEAVLSMQIEGTRSSLVHLTDA